MNPIIKQELRCELCDCTLPTPPVRVLGLSMPLVVTTCTNSRCDNNGILLIMHPPTLKSQIWVVIGKVLVPGSYAETGVSSMGQQFTVGGRK